MGFFSSIFGGYSEPHIMFHGTRFTPEGFGKAAVVWSTDSSQGVVRSIISLGESSEAPDSIYTRMAENLAVSQIQIMPLDVALYAYALLHSKGTTQEIARGFRAGMESTFINGPFKGEAQKAMIILVAIYGGLLAREPENSGFIMSSAVSDAVTNILCEGMSRLDKYKNRPALEVSTFQRNAISLIVTTCIANQLKVFAEMNFHVVPA